MFLVSILAPGYVFCLVLGQSLLLLTLVSVLFCVPACAPGFGLLYFLDPCCLPFCLALFHLIKLNTFEPLSSCLCFLPAHVLKLFTLFIFNMKKNEFLISYNN